MSDDIRKTGFIAVGWAVLWAIAAAALIAFKHDAGRNNEIALNAISAASVVVAIVLAVFTYRLFRIASEVARSTEHSDRIAALPLLEIGAAEAVYEDRKFTGFRFKVRNAGRGPAYGVEVLFDLRIAADAPEHDRERALEQLREFNATSNAIADGYPRRSFQFIAPKSKTNWMSVSPLEIPEIDLVSTVGTGGRWVLMFCASIGYRDLYGDVLVHRQRIEFDAVSFTAFGDGTEHHQLKTHTLSWPRPSFLPEEKFDGSSLDERLRANELPKPPAVSVRARAQ